MRNLCETGRVQHKLSAVGIGLALVLAGNAVRAYPTSVVFAPTGDTLALGGYGAFVYSSLSFNTPNALTGVMGTQNSSTWVGTTFGIFPSFSYGEGIEFGGVEIGASLLTPDAIGNPRIMTLFDAKIGALAEGKYHPAIGIGFMGLSTLPRQMTNLGYLSLTKTLKAGETSYGRITAGLGRMFVPSSQLYPGCESSGEPCAFRGAFPFADKNVMLILGYESPKFGPFSIGVDHVGGTSVLSSTNAAFNLIPTEGVYITLGAFLANERRESVTGGVSGDGLFMSVSYNGNFKDLVPSKEEPEHAPPEPTSAPKPLPPQPTQPQPTPTTVHPPAEETSIQ